MLKIMITHINLFIPYLGIYAKIIGKKLWKNKVKQIKLLWIKHLNSLPLNSLVLSVKITNVPHIHYKHVLLMNL